MASQLSLYLDRIRSAKSGSTDETYATIPCSQPMSCCPSALLPALWATTRILRFNPRPTEILASGVMRRPVTTMRFFREPWYVFLALISSLGVAVRVMTSSDSLQTSYSVPDSDDEK